MKRTKPRRQPPGPGQRSVWDFPRPPAIERETRPLRVVLGGVEVASTQRAVKVLETSHPPVFYIPPEDVRTGLLSRREGASMCEWKGEAAYYDVVVGDRVAEGAAFAYPRPTRRFAAHAGWFSFYAGPFADDPEGGCFVGDEEATPQPGGFYSGWITRDVVGPFKGVAGSWGW